MAALDHSSGKSRRSKRSKHVNVRAKAAMRIAVDIHRKLCPQSKRYYEKKRAEGKKYNQAIRARGRHLCPVIFKMLKNDRPYQNPTLNNDHGSQRHFWTLQISAGMFNSTYKDHGRRVRAMRSKAAIRALPSPDFGPKGCFLIRDCERGAGDRRDNLAPISLKSLRHPKVPLQLRFQFQSQRFLRISFHKARL